MSETKQFEFSPSISIIVAGVIVAAAIVYTNANPSQPSPQAGGQQAAPVAVRAPSAQDHIYGSLNAPIVLIEYSDFECPFCSRVHPTLKKIVDDSNGQIAWVYRNFPLSSIHPEAGPAANAAECIAAQLGNAGFWRFANTVFADQSKLGASYYEQLAGQFGADTAQFKSCIAGSAYQAAIAADTAEASNNGGDGTPYTIVWSKNTQLPVSGARPEVDFLSVIQQVKSRQ